MKLYGYWRSSASYRVRIALELKGLSYAGHAVNLKAGDQHSPSWKARNPQGLVPVLETEEGRLIQSGAILEWLEEIYPNPPLLPEEPFRRARARAVCAIIACEIAPLQNLRTGQYLSSVMDADDHMVLTWRRHWISKGLEALEAMLEQEESEGDFCFGTTPGLVEAYLVPQLYAARRFGVDPAPYKRLCRADKAASRLEAFQKAHPDQQPDAVTP